MAYAFLGPLDGPTWFLLVAFPCLDKLPSIKNANCIFYSFLFVGCSLGVGVKCKILKKAEFFLRHVMRSAYPSPVPFAQFFSIEIFVSLVGQLEKSNHFTFYLTFVSTQPEWRINIIYLIQRFPNLVLGHRFVVICSLPNKKKKKTHLSLWVTFFGGTSSLKIWLTV